MTRPLYVMSTVEYLLAAILGVVLAYVCIMGWRRLIPCFVIGFCLANSPHAALAQYQSFDPDADVPAINEVRDAVINADYSNQSYLQMIHDMMYYLDQDNDYASLQQIDSSLQTVATYIQYVQSSINALPFYLDSDNDSSLLMEVRDKIDQMRGDLAGLDSDDDAQQLQDIRDAILQLQFLFYNLDQDNDVPAINDLEVVLLDIDNKLFQANQYLEVTRDATLNIDGNLEAVRNTLENTFADGTVELNPNEGELEPIADKPAPDPADANPNPDDAPDIQGDINEKLGDGSYNNDFIDKFDPNEFVTIPTDNPSLPTAGSFDLGGGGMFSITADITTPMVDLFNQHQGTIRTIITGIICATILLSSMNTSWRMYAS